jgi:hypothetical protein
MIEVKASIRKNQKVKLGDLCFIDTEGNIAIKCDYRDNRGRFAKVDKLPVVGVAISEVDNNGLFTVRLGRTL